jgi:hypothetical protein
MKDRHCKLCGILITRPQLVCTNGRCSHCHERYCTPGGASEPGHGLGNPPTCFHCGYLLSVEPCTTQIIDGEPQRWHTSCWDRRKEQADEQTTS